MVTPATSIDAPERQGVSLITGGLLGFGWFLAVGGAAALNPTALDWVSGDVVAHVLGWWFFRTAPWGFPLGLASDYMPAMAVTVAFTDSIPWLSVLLKPWSPLLPVDFHFFGLWLASCFVLQGVFAVKILRLLTARLHLVLAGAGLFVCSPVLLFRVGHPALCAHWLILGMVWLHLRANRRRPRASNTVAWAFCLSVLAAGIHPYLAFMLLGLGAGLLVSLVVAERQLSIFAGALSFLGIAVAMILVWLVFGYVGRPVGVTGWGFGFYNSDLLTLVNPTGWSLVLPGLEMGPGQYEGFGYLGSGALALAAVAIGTLPEWRRAVAARWRGHAPFAAAAIGLAVLALASNVTVAGRIVLDLEQIYRMAGPLVDPFRSSGRFIWPLHYLTLTAVTALTLHTWQRRPALASALLIGALVLQVADTSALWTRRIFVPPLSASLFGGAPWLRLNSPVWSALDERYRHIALVPPVIIGEESPCSEGDLPEAAAGLFADLAYRKRLTTNSGSVSRPNSEQARETCRALRERVARGTLDTDTVYVVSPSELSHFARLGNVVTCGTLDQYHVCVVGESGPFRDALAAS